MANCLLGPCAKYMDKLWDSQLDKLLDLLDKLLLQKKKKKKTR